MYKLLLVDDEAIIRQGVIYSVNWERLDIQVSQASNGLEAYEMISSYDYDIAIVDIKMPGLSGLELIEKVKSNNTNIIFIILSGYAEFSLAKQAMRYGVKYYLLKPADENEITSILENVINEIKNRAVSYENISLLLENICLCVKNCDKEDFKDRLEDLFDIFVKYEIGKAFIKKYCLELYIKIIGICADAEQIPRYFRMSTEEEKWLSSDSIYNLIFEVGNEIINSNVKNSEQKYSEAIRVTLKYICENIDNEELSLSWIANKSYMNSDYLGKLFKKEMQENFNQYLTNIRVNKAKEIIEREKNCKICDIAEKVGFGGNSQYFSQVFKKCTGHTPKEYKELICKSL
jgi:two-component system response regulator YesN